MARPNQQFQTTKTAEIPRSSFDLSHGLKTTVDAGLLVPILSLEVLPGDTINCKASIFGRLATPLKPVLENIYCETFFFFTPWRQVWRNFPKFMGEQTKPGDSIDFTIPKMVGTNPVSVGSLADYFGIPIGTEFANVQVSALPFRAYNAVYNYWFRDENLIDNAYIADGDTDSGAWNNNYPIQRRRKRRDYITAGLPFPQKGEAVTVSLGGFANVATQAQAGQNILVQQDPIGDIGGDNGTFNMTAGTATVQLGAADVLGGFLYADLSEASGISINDLREGFQIQKLLERDARGGTRYPEILQSHFRVSDPSLLVHQRPLYLGGGSTMVQINPVPQTSGTASDPETGYTPEPQGNLAAYGTVMAKNHGFVSSFTEHGHILGLINFRADLTYQQGLERYWSRQTRYDFFWPVLSHLSEQATLNKEVFVSNAPEVDDAVFAYMPRYDEYRYKPSLVTGIMRSAATASLDVWHLAQDFAALPTLNKAFIEDNPPMDRISAVPSEPDFLVDVYFKIRAARPLPMHATPGLIDHF